MDTAIGELQNVIQTCPIVDNHAHNLLLPKYLDRYDFAAITTEAQGAALKDTYTSLSHIRGANQLKELYALDEDADWNAILAKRASLIQEDAARLIRTCMEGTHTILMDDGLDSDTVHPYQDHDQFTVGKTRRIVRIEVEAQGIMKGLIANPERRFSTDSDGKDALWVEFARGFEQRIKDLIVDPEVAGFKSVVCYRTGLDVEPNHLSEAALATAVEDFHIYVDVASQGNYRIQHKGVNDFLVAGTLQLLSNHAKGTGKTKPLQFHTGLGDSDINLLRSNPAYLQPLIERYPHVPFVILHSSYPYTREAGYLATVFANAYLDVGEVFPMLNRDGQVSVLRHAIELTPWSKLLWSTDGHWFPETYWLANKQFREALEVVLTALVNYGDLSVAQATDAAKAIVYGNSNRLYDLGLPLDPMQQLPKKLLTEQEMYPAKTRGTVPIIKSSSPYNPAEIQDLQALEGSLDYIFVSWLDYTSTLRTRIFPFAAFLKLVSSGRRFTITTGAFGILQNDTPTPACNTTGTMYVEPDLSTRCLNNISSPSAATILAYWRDETGSPHPACPRGLCETLLSRLSTTHNISLAHGFEIEIVFMWRSQPPSASTPPSYNPLTTTSAWSTLRPSTQPIVLSLLDSINKALSSRGIHLQMLHAESSPGQFEFVLPPLPALSAITTLIHTRQIISSVADSHGLLSTLHPKPYPAAAGTASHIHASLNPSSSSSSSNPDLLTGVDSQTNKRFWVSGVLKHLRAISAFTLPISESYARVADDTWSGGRWIAWGTQNRETPLRRIAPSPMGDAERWEVRCVDGIENVYLGVAAVVAAGLLGLEGKEIGEGDEPRDCPFNPSKMTKAQFQEYNIKEPMPSNLEEALVSLEQDAELKALLGEDLSKNYVSIKQAEKEMLDGMGEEERRSWLIERY
ncbi:MAG: hypothetical protein M1820_002714 [Bogoriella megaspora]|nr:MAG: hypothetical protein M1820_002714 [Bogoriella megaspora]